jgi:RHS repeat-associated protein
MFTRTTTGVENYLTDPLGSTVATTDSTGALATQYTYEPFGNTTSTGSATSNAFQYTGRENDGTGLYFNRARYYSPRLQRFISQDPIGFGGGDTNLYAYTFNSPTNLTDPGGNTAGEMVLAGCLFGPLGCGTTKQSQSLPPIPTKCLWAVRMAASYTGRWTADRIG